MANFFKIIITAIVCTTTQVSLCVLCFSCFISVITHRHAKLHASIEHMATQAYNVIGCQVSSGQVFLISGKWTFTQFLSY